MPALIAWWTRDLATLLGADRGTGTGRHAVHDAAAHNDAVGPNVLRAGVGLLQRWSEPQRRYHTTAHLVEVLRAVDALGDAGEIHDREACVGHLAGWFHDAVYEPGAAPGTNESASARLARQSLTRLGLRDQDAAQVEHLVRLTDGHDTRNEDALSCVFQDADLWILCTPSERFDAYCAQVRQEYAQVSDPAYRSGRIAVLEPFLARESIYRTAHARASWEQPARANLARELARLRAGTA